MTKDFFFKFFDQHKKTLQGGTQPLKKKGWMKKNRLVGRQVFTLNVGTRYNIENCKILKKNMRNKKKIKEKENLYLKPIGHVSNANPVSICMCYNNDFVTSLK